MLTIGLTVGLFLLFWGITLSPAWAALATPACLAAIALYARHRRAHQARVNSAELKARTMWACHRRRRAPFKGGKVCLPDFTAPAA